MIKKYLTILLSALILLSPFISHAQTVSRHGRLCNIAKKQGLASCNIQVLLDDNNLPLVGNSPAGFGPAQLRGAYSVSGRASGQPIIAVVDAYDDPTLKKDLDVYSAQYNLPTLPLCKTTALKSTMPCLQKINQTGGTSLAAPIIAAIYALGGVPKNQPANSLPYLFNSKNSLHDIVSGNNGDCFPMHLCTAKTKYDGPTGLGSPKGTGAF